MGDNVVGPGVIGLEHVGEDDILGSDTSEEEGALEEPYVAPETGSGSTKALHSKRQEVRRRCARGRDPAAPARGAAAAAGMAVAVTEGQRLRAQSPSGAEAGRFGGPMRRCGPIWRQRTTVPTVDHLDILRPLFQRANSLPDCNDRVLFLGARLAALAGGG